MLILSSTVVMVIDAIEYNVNSWNVIGSMRSGMLDMQMVRPYGLATIMISTQSGAKTLISALLQALSYLHMLH